MGKGGGGKGGGGRSHKFASRTFQSWICGLCERRNPHDAAFCNRCGKSRRWVQKTLDKNAQVVNRSTDELRKVFEEFKYEFYAKGLGKGKDGGGKGKAGGGGTGGGKGGGGGAGRQTNTVAQSNAQSAKPKGDTPKSDPKQAQPKVVPGKDVYVLFEGKEVNLDTLHDFLRTMAKLGEEQRDL